MLKNSLFLRFSIILCLSTALSLPAAAFLFRKKHKAVKLPARPSEHINIQKKYNSNKHHYKLNLEVKIPADKEFLIIEQSYDELKDIELKELNIERLVRKNKTEKIKPFKISKRIDKDSKKQNIKAEDAYDLISSGKNMMLKSFFFEKTKVFKDKDKEQLSLALHWQTGAKNSVTIAEHQLYASDPGELAIKKPSLPAKAIKDEEQVHIPTLDEIPAEAIKQSRGGVAGTGFSEADIVRQQELYKMDLQAAQDGFDLSQRALQGDQYVDPQMMMQQMMMQQNPMYGNPMMNPGLMQGAPGMINPMMMQNPALFQQMMQSTPPRQ